MQERLLSAQAGTAGKLGQAVLYFGCRRSDQDYLYGSLLEDWAKSGHLTLFTAFSRQQVTTVSLIACSVSKQCSEGCQGQPGAWCSLQGKRLRAQNWCSVMTNYTCRVMLTCDVLQARKVYVQDRLRESGALVWKLLQAGGHFYVCGDAAHMAGAMERALLDAIEAHQVLLRIPDHTVYQAPLQSCCGDLG